MPTSSEACHREHPIENQSKRYHARRAHSPAVTSYAAKFPSSSSQKPQKGYALCILNVIFVLVI